MLSSISSLAPLPRHPQDTLRARSNETESTEIGKVEAGESAESGKETKAPSGSIQHKDAAKAVSENPFKRVQLKESEERLIVSLQRRDKEVRSHEAAHAAAGGALAGGPNISFRTGPDGKRYAASGHVNIDTAAVRGDPQATIQKMQQVKQAALAPADPSGQDQRVAASADAKLAQAVHELSLVKAEEVANPLRKVDGDKLKGDKTKPLSGDAKEASEPIGARGDHDGDADDVKNAVGDSNRAKASEPHPRFAKAIAAYEVNKAA